MNPFHDYVLGLCAYFNRRMGIRNGHKCFGVDSHDITDLTHILRGQRIGHIGLNLASLGLWRMALYEGMPGLSIKSLQTYGSAIRVVEGHFRTDARAASLSTHLRGWDQRIIVVLEIEDIRNPSPRVSNFVDEMVTVVLYSFLRLRSSCCRGVSRGQVRGCTGGRSLRVLSS
jgi:hypothetical protein